MTKDDFERSVLELWMTTCIPLTRANLQHHTGLSGKQTVGFLKQLMADSRLGCKNNDAGELEWSVPGAARPADGPQSFGEKDKLARLMAEVQVEVEEKRLERTTKAAELEAAKRARLEQAKKDQLAKAARAKQSEGTTELVATGKTDSGDARKGGWLSRLFGRGSVADAIDIAQETKSELTQTKARGKGKKSLAWSGGLSFVLGPVGWLYAGAFRESIPAAAGWMVFGAIAQKLPMFMLWPIVGLALPASGLVGLVYGWQYNRKGKRHRLFKKDTKKLKK